MNSIQQNTALEQGVKLIGIGKHGSKKLSDELVIAINQELKTQTSPPILIGAFFGALMMKEIQASYLVLEEYLGKGCLSDASLLWNKLCEEAPSKLKPLGIKLINKETLNLAEAKALGDFLFSENSGEAFRGLAVSILRIRYESDEEYQGLYEAIIEGESKQPSLELNSQKGCIQLAEPFDGVEHSYMITPLIANELEKEGYDVLVTCGRSSGPKITLNTWDLYKVLTKNEKYSSSEMGHVIDQKIVYPKLEAWVDRRRVIMKRPFLSTLEKVLNPFKANILICSVFHIPYLEKMAHLGHMAGFEGVIVLKRGLEGSLAASLSKSTGVFCSLKKADGTIITSSFDGTHEEFERYKTEQDAIIEDLSLQKNLDLVDNYLKNGSSGDIDFDNRVRLSIGLYKKGLDWILQVKAS